MAIRVLHLVSNLGPNAQGRAASRLIPTVPDCDSKTINLGAAFFPLATEGHLYRHPLDLTLIRTIRETVSSFRPDLIHAWGPLAVRLTAAVPRIRFVASHIPDLLDVFTQWRLRSARTIIKSNFLISSLAQSAPQPFVSEPVILASGGFDQEAGMRYAVWAFDIIRYLYPDLRLVLLGDGPLRSCVRRFSQSLRQTGQTTRFLGWQSDIHEWLERSTCVWLTHKTGGLTFAAEAKACGVTTIGWGTQADITVNKYDPSGLAAVTHDFLNRRAINQIEHCEIPTPLSVADRLRTVYDTVSR